MWSLAPDDQPRPLRPGGQIDAVGDLCHLAVVALGAVLVERRNPSICGDCGDRLADRFGQVIAEREAQIGIAAVISRLVRGASPVRAHQDLDPLDVLGGNLGKRPVEHDLMIGGGIRSRVARPEHHRQRLPGLIGVDVQRLKAKAALVVASRTLLLRMGADQRRVQIERQPLRRAVQLPEPLTPAGMSRTQPIQQPLGCDPVDRPKGCRVRRHLPEQRLLVAHRTEIRDALAAVSEHHRQIPNHPTRIMTTTALLEPPEPHRQRPREPQLVGHLNEQRGARPRHQSLSVRRDLYRENAFSTHHLQGEPPQGRPSLLADRRIATHSDISAPPPAGGAGITAKSGLVGPWASRLKQTRTFPGRHDMRQYRLCNDHGR